MSWEQQINQNFIITCGDGATYQPLYDDKAIVKDVEYNLSEFNFPNVEGTFVDRRLRKGNRYAMTIVFQGANHLDEVARFENSAKDRRPWVVEHPKYGRLNVQPASLNFNDETLNFTRVTGTLLETILRGVPTITINPQDQIVNLQRVAFDSGAVLFASEPPIPQNMAVANASLYSSGVNSGALQLQTENYFNLFNDANAAILNATAEPLAAIRALQAVILAPSQFSLSVRQRLQIFTNQLNLLFGTVANISSQANKYQFEITTGSLITSMCSTASTPLPQDYVNMVDVLNVVDIILNAQSTFISSLDFLQTDNGGNTDSYISGFRFISDVTNTVNYTVSELFEIAISAQQERSILCDSDTNVILLAHRFYGLLIDDSTIQRVMDNNSIGISEILDIKKGRKILYYV
jgi:hypothetical protein